MSPLEASRRQRMLADTNAAYAALRVNSKAWREEQEERRLWETTLADGLDGAVDRALGP